MEFKENDIAFVTHEYEKYNGLAVKLLCDQFIFDEKNIWGVESINSRKKFLFNMWEEDLRPATKQELILLKLRGLI